MNDRECCLVFCIGRAAHVSLSDNDPMIAMQHPKFDPYSAPEAFVLQLVEKLVEAGRRIDMPSA